jgi:hypothetical protein
MLVAAIAGAAVAIAAVDRGTGLEASRVMRIRGPSGVVVVLALAVSVPALAGPAVVTAPTPPQPAQGPPGSAAGAGTGASGNAVAFGRERFGPFVDASVYGGEGLMYGDLQMGWMINSHIGVFGSFGGVVAEEGGAGLKGIGVRLANGPVFAEARLDWLSVSSDCDLDGPCMTETAHVADVGVGLEFVHTRHFGLEVRGKVLTNGRGMLGSLGLGLAFYF